MSGKHAYLVMAHEYSDVLWTLLRLLDDERNDIFLHMDKKNREKVPEKFANVVQKAGYHFMSKVVVTWGTDSIAKAEMVLLDAAVKEGPYQYYHLVSGADLPIKSQDEIHKWFDEHQGKEFMHFGTEQYQEDIASRYRVYHFFEKQIGKKRDKPFWLQVETYSQAIQRRLHVNRVKNCEWKHFYGGANWFSITHDFALLVLKEYKEKRKYFRHTLLTEEFFMQTMLMNSEFADRLYMPGFVNDHAACARYIDWNRGNPYVWRSEDFEELIHAPGCFARKFDQNVDKKIVELLYEYLKNRE